MGSPIYYVGIAELKKSDPDPPSHPCIWLQNPFPSQMYYCCEILVWKLDNGPCLQFLLNLSLIFCSKNLDVLMDFDYHIVLNLFIFACISFQETLAYHCLRKLKSSQFIYICLVFHCTTSDLLKAGQACSWVFMLRVGSSFPGEGGGVQIWNFFLAKCITQLLTLALPNPNPAEAPKEI